MQYEKSGEDVKSAPSLVFRQLEAELLPPQKKFVPLGDLKRPAAGGESDTVGPKSKRPPTLISAKPATLPNSLQSPPVTEKPKSTPISPQTEFTPTESLEIYAELDKFQLGFHKLNLFNAKFPSLSSLKRELRIAPGTELRELNSVLERKMLDKLGFCFYISNFILYLRTHSRLRYKKFLVPIANLVGDRIDFFNHAQSALAQAKLFIDYDKVRLVSMKNHAIFNRINAMLLPRDCKLRVNWPLFDKFCISYAMHSDDKIRWGDESVPGIFSLTELRTPEKQLEVIRRIQRNFVEVNPEFVKTEDSIRRFIKFYYTNILI